MRSILLVVVCLVFGANKVWALTFDTERQRPKVKRVGIIAFKNYTRETATIFDQRRRSTKNDDLLERVRRSLVHRLGSEGWLELVDLQAKFKDYQRGQAYQERLTDAEFLHRSGRNHFKALRLKEARDTLLKAQSKYLSLFAHVIYPRRFAEIALTLAQVHHDLGEPDRATEQLLTMFAVAPSIYIPARYYDGAFEKRIRAAHRQLTEQGLMIQVPLQNPLISRALLHRFMNAMRLDALLFAYLHRRNGAVQLRFLIYERTGPSSALDTNITVEGERSRRVELLADMAFSRWLTCTDFEFEGQRRQKFKRFYIDASYAISTYLQHARLTRRLFPNMGFGVNFSFQIRENLAIFTKFNLWSSLADPKHDLLENFKSIRGVVGVGVTWPLGRWRIYLAGGFDFMGYSENFKTSTNPNCKFFPSTSGLCPADDVNRLDTRFQLGINVAFGVQFDMFRGVYVALQGNYTFFFFPFNRESQLNSPLSMEFGLGYRFR